MKHWSVLLRSQLLFSLTCIDAFTLVQIQDYAKRRVYRYNGNPIFASREGLVTITDVEAELIAQKIREESLIDIPMVPGFMEKVVVEQGLKAILEVGPVVLPRDVFNRLVSGEGGGDACKLT